MNIIKKPVIIINSFETVSLDNNKKPIVICDIDHTFLRPSPNYIDIYNQIKHDFQDQKELEKVVSSMYEMCITHSMVRQTDKEGFANLIQRINELQGKLIFLTARSPFSHEKTLRDFKTVGFDEINKYEIHYTGNEITKGFYIMKNKLLNGYNQHIFIDDIPHFLESALKFYPTMDCYLFKYNKVKIY